MKLSAFVALLGLLLVAGIAFTTGALATTEQTHAQTAKVASTPVVSPSATPCPLFWRTVPSQSYAGSSSSDLRSVGVISSTDAWAVGTSNRGGQAGPTGITEHWDGSQWSLVPIPLLYEDNLLGVTAISSHDVWAVGSYDNGFSFWPLTLHWDGTTWTQFLTPQTGISGSASQIAALASDDIWAVGDHLMDLGGGTYANQTWILHWDGTQWNDIPSPNGPSDQGELTSLSAISPSDIWAAGNYSIGGVHYYTLIEHWNGVNWSVVESPTPEAESVLQGVDALSTSDAWAVGTSENGAFALHWDGTLWSLSPIDVAGISDSYLYGVAANSPTDVWAVGSMGDVVGPTWRKTLILHWDGSSWSRANSPDLEMEINELYDVSAKGESPWAVGSSSSLSSSEHTLAVRQQGEVCCVTTYSDVVPANYFYDAVEYLSCLSAISGYSDGTFRPANTTTRGQLSKILVAAEGWSIDTMGGPHFTDVPQAHTFYPWIETAYNRGLISGYADGTFQPQNEVSRGQLAKVTVLAEGWATYTPQSPTFSDMPAGSTFYDYVETAYHHTIINGYGDGTYRPGNSATRGQIAKIVFLAISLP